jgi:hypothetical protein
VVNLTQFGEKSQKNFTKTVSILYYLLNEPSEDQLPTFTLVGVGLHREVQFSLATAKSK